MRKLLLAAIGVGIVVVIALKILKGKELAQENDLIAKKFDQQDKIKQTSTSSTTGNSATATAATTSGSSKKLPSAQAPVQTDIPKTEDASIEHFAQTLFINTNYEKSHEELIEDLERLDLAPINNKRSNPDTGDLNIIRTNKTLPGTRHFHAQFFGSGNNQILQHMSFEFKPGKGAFEKGINVLKQQFKISAPAKIDTDSMKAWPVENGYIAWVKKLTQDDLDNDPFNAYTKDDVGTIKVAIEVDIHADMDEEGEDHSH